VMAAITCSQCGAEFDGPARFCRRCGNTLGAGEPSISPSEATTKSFDYPAAQNPPEGSRTAPANQWPTAPAYLAPDQVGVAPQYPAFPGANTQGFARKHSKAPFVILGILGCVLVAVIAAFALIISQVGRHPSRSGYTAGPNSGGPGAPDGPGQTIPGHPGIPIPPNPPGPPGPSNGITGPLASLIYPGSQTVMNVEGDNGGSVVQLTSSDPTDKVVEWYVAKISPSKRVTLPFVGTILESKQAKVIIRPGPPTTIMLTRDED
jgi:hypothetical protein